MTNGKATVTKSTTLGMKSGDRPTSLVVANAKAIAAALFHKRIAIRLLKGTSIETMRYARTSAKWIPRFFSALTAS